jgi:hypothetical protein
MLRAIWLDFQLFQSYKLVAYCSSSIVVSEHFQYCIVGLNFDHIAEHFRSYKLHVFIVLYSYN